MFDGKSTRSLVLLAALAGFFVVACGQERSAEPIARTAAPAVTPSPSPVPTPPPSGTVALVRSETKGSTAASPDVAFSGSREETERFIGYYKTIRLTPEQERVKVEALSAIRAPCCADNPLATCCCPCNMAKAAWGLSAWLIAQKGYGPEQLREAVQQWLAAANPNGFTGDAC